MLRLFLILNHNSRELWSKAIDTSCLQVIPEKLQMRVYFKVMTTKDRYKLSQRVILPTLTHLHLIGFKKSLHYSKIET